MHQMPMHFTVHDPCGGGNADFCAPVMVGRGAFDNNTLGNFKAALARYRREYDISPPATGLSAVIFSSPGGSLAAGLALGLEVRRLKLDTRAVSEFNEYLKKGPADYLESPLLRNAKCLSACVYAFLGGIRRVVESEDVLGVHQFRSKIFAQNLESNAQATTAQLSLYIERMGVSPKLMTIASLTKPNDLTYLGTELSRALNVDNVNIALSKWTVAATNDGAAMLSVHQVIDQSRDVKINFLSDVQGLLVSVTTTFNLLETRSDRPELFPDLETPTIIFKIDGKEYKGSALKGWEKTIGPNSISFSSISSFPKSMLTALQSATTLSVSDDFGRSTSDLSLSTQLSLNGLRTGVMLLSRTSR